VPAGTTRVVLSYRPKPFHVGLALAVAGLALLCLAIKWLPRLKWPMGLASQRRRLVALSCAALAVAVVVGWCIWVVRPAMRRAAGLIQGMAEMERGNLDAALEMFAAVLESRPDSASALHLSGQCHARAGRPELAVEVLRRASQVRPRSTPITLLLAESLMHLGRLDEAKATLESGVKRLPFADKLHLALGKCYAATREPAKAVRSLARAIDLRLDVRLAADEAFESLRTRPDFVTMVVRKRRALDTK